MGGGRHVQLSLPLSLSPCLPVSLSLSFHLSLCHLSTFTHSCNLRWDPWPRSSLWGGPITREEGRGAAAPRKGETNGGVEPKGMSVAAGREWLRLTDAMRQDPPLCLFRCRATAQSCHPPPPFHSTSPSPFSSNKKCISNFAPSLHGCVSAWSRSILAKTPNKQMFWNVSRAEWALGWCSVVTLAHFHSHSLLPDAQ